MVSAGKNLNILIIATYSCVGDWMAFALCYSIKRNLPEATFSVKTTGHSTTCYFSWVNRFCSPRGKPPNLRISEPGVVLVRPLDTDLQLGESIVVDGNICSDVKDDKFTPFLSYRSGCGGFVMDEWINKEECVFPYVDDFVTTNINANEMQVLKLWKQAGGVYPLLAGG